MNQHAGPATAMSVLIIGLFAILLHDRPPQPKAQNSSIAAKSTDKPPSNAPEAPKSPSKPASEVALKVEVKEQAQPKVLPRQVARTEVSSPSLPTVDNHKLPVVSPLAPHPSPLPVSQPVLPKAPFTVVKAGEKLADVAWRIYGTSAAAESLWRANRDQVASLDSNLASGTLLRTP